MAKILTKSVRRKITCESNASAASFVLFLLIYFRHLKAFKPNNMGVSLFLCGSGTLALWR